MITCPNCQHLFEAELPPSLAEVADFKNWQQQLEDQKQREEAAKPLPLSLNPQTFVTEGVTETRR